MNVSTPDDGLNDGQPIALEFDLVTVAHVSRPIASLAKASRELLVKQLRIRFDLLVQVA